MSEDLMRKLSLISKRKAEASTTSFFSSFATIFSILNARTAD